MGVAAGKRLGVLRAVDASARTQAGPVRLLVVIKLRLHAEALCASLELSEEFEVLGLAASLEGALAAIAGKRPDLILFDMGLPRSLEAVRALSDAAADAKLLALGPDDDEFVVRCAKAGAAGFVSREASTFELRQAIDRVLGGELSCHPRLARRLWDEVRRGARERRAAHGTLSALTAREAEIARLVAQGLTNREIAERLFIGLSTVKNHVHSVFDKLRLRRRSEIAAVLSSPLV